MLIILFRHGIAEDVSAADHDRNLTAEGRRRTLAAATGLCVSLDLSGARIMTSPLVRAWQSADILASTAGSAHPTRWPELAPGTAPEMLAESLRRYAESVVLVGHQPDLGRWLTWALTGRAADCIPLKKAGAACLQFPQRPAVGQARLEWLLNDRQLAALGDARASTNG